MTYLSGLQALIDSWEDPFIEPDPTEVFQQSPAGNINRDGTSACADSPIFVKYHRYFKRSLEVGVRDLTIALILKFNCITYSSCQGHPGTSDAIMRPRYIAIVPRHPQEYQTLFKLLHHLADQTNAAFPQSAVKVVIGNDLLESDDRAPTPCLTLFFQPTDGNETRYFQEVEPIYQFVLTLVQSYPNSGNSS